MNFHIVTIFPDILTSYLSESILLRAQKNKIISVKTYDIRKFSKDKHKKVDDVPYAGGPGMVMTVDPIIRCVSDILNKINKKYEIAKTKKTKNSKIKKPKILIVNFTPGKKEFNTEVAKETSVKFTDIIFICGRYEGVDARVSEILKAEEWSIGNYVLTGGELAALVCIDSISRQIKGVLGKYESLEEERVSSHKVYTRPSVYEYQYKNSKDIKKNKKYKVPEVLMNGNHKLIDEWRKSN